MMNKAKTYHGNGKRAETVSPTDLYERSEDRLRSFLTETRKEHVRSRERHAQRHEMSCLHNSRDFSTKRSKGK